MSPELINNIATLAGVIVAALGAFIFALWVAMGIWTFNDIRSRTRDWLAIILAVLLVMVFPLIGLILYTLIRPKATLADVYDRALEEEALLRELEETHACATCGVPTKDNWVFCPNCHAQLQHTCPTCSNMVRNEWAICVFCGTPQRAGAPPRVVAPEIGSHMQPAFAANDRTGDRVLDRDRQVSSSQQALAQGGAQPASASLRRSGRNPFSQPGSTPAPASNSTYLPPTTGNSSGGGMTGNPMPDLDMDENPYRPTTRPSEGS